MNIWLYYYQSLYVLLFRQQAVEPPSCLMILVVDCTRLMAITVQPNVMQTYAAYVSQVRFLVSFR